MTAHVRIAGVWKEITEMHVRVAGVWKEITEGHVRVSSVWKEFYSSGPAINLTNVSEVGFGVGSSAGVKMTNSGKWQSGLGGGSSPSYSDVDALEWADPESASIGDDYHCRLVTSSGTLSTGTADSWLALTSDREFTVVETRDFSGTMEISDDGGSTTITTCTVFISAGII